MSPIEQARVDMQLHADAIKDQDRFDNVDDNFLAQDMELKRRFIGVLKRGKTRPSEARELAAGLGRDVSIHQDYLKRPEDPNTGTHEWHRTWIGVYGKWLKMLGQSPEKPRFRSRMPMPPAPPPDDEEERMARGDYADDHGDEINIPDENRYRDESGNMPDLGDPDDTDYDRQVRQEVQDRNQQRMEDEWAAQDERREIGRNETPGQSVDLTPGGGYNDNEFDLYQEEDYNDERLSSNDFKDERDDEDERESLDDEVQYAARKDAERREARLNEPGGAYNELFREEKERIIGGREAAGETVDRNNFEQMSVINKQAGAIANEKFKARQAADQVAADFDSLNGRFEERLTQAASEGEAFILGAIERAGFQRTAEGWEATGDQTEEDFLRAQAQANAEFTVTHLDPIVAEWQASSTQLQQDTTAMLRSREASALIDQLRNDAQGKFDGVLDKTMKAAGAVGWAVDKSNLGDIPLGDLLGVPGLVGKVTAEALGIDDPTLSDGLSAAMKALDAYSQYVTRPIAEAYTQDRIAGVSLAEVAAQIGIVPGVGVIESFHKAGVISDEMRLMAYEVILDPSNAIPGVGVYGKIDDLAKIARVSKTAIEASRVLADDAIRKAPRIGQLLKEEIGSIGDIERGVDATFNVKVYRGRVDTDVRSMDGAFVTTNRELAQHYADTAAANRGGKAIVDEFMADVRGLTPDDVLTHGGQLTKNYTVADGSKLRSPMDDVTRRGDDAEDLIQGFSDDPMSRFSKGESVPSINPSPRQYTPSEISDAKARLASLPKAGRTAEEELALQTKKRDLLDIIEGVSSPVQGRRPIDVSGTNPIQPNTGPRTQRVGDNLIDVDTGEVLSISAPQRSPETQRAFEQAVRVDRHAEQTIDGEVIRTFPDRKSALEAAQREAAGRTGKRGMGPIERSRPPAEPVTSLPSNFRVAKTGEPVSIDDAISLVQEELARTLKGVQSAGQAKVIQTYNDTIDAAHALLQVAPDAKLTARLVEAAKSGTGRAVLQAELRRAGNEAGLGSDVKQFVAKVRGEAVYDEMVRKAKVPSKTDNRATIEARLRETAERVFRAEKDPLRETTAAETALINKDWRAFSKSRGYTDAEIADFEHLIDLQAEAIRLGLTKESEVWAKDAWATVLNKVEDPFAAYDAMKQAEELNQDARDVIVIVRESLAEESTAPLKSSVSRATADKLSPETRQLLELKAEQLDDQQWTAVMTGLTKEARPDELRAIAKEFLKVQTRTNGATIALENALSVASPGALSGGMPPAATGKTASAAPFGGAKKPEGIRDFADLAILGEPAKYSVTDHTRNLIKWISRDNHKFFKNGWTRTHDAALQIGIEGTTRESAHRMTATKWGIEATADFLTSGQKLGLGARIRVTAQSLISPGAAERRAFTDLKMTMSQLIDGAPTNLTAGQKAFRDKWRARFQELDDWLRGAYGATDDTFRDELNLEAGQLLPSPRLNSKKELVRDPFYGEFFGKNPPGSVPYESDPMAIIVKAAEARLRWMDDKWTEQAILKLEDPTLALDAKLPHLAESIEKLEAHLLGLTDFDEIQKTKAAIRGAQNSYDEILAVTKRKELPSDWLKHVHEINNTLRQLTATMDMSYLGVQGAVGFFHDPVSFGKSFMWSVSHLDPTGIGGSMRVKYMKEHAGVINYGLEHNLFIAGTNNMNEIYASTIIDHMPVANKIASLASILFSEAGNTYRTKQLQLAMQVAAVRGKNWSIKEADELVAGINKMTGASTSSPHEMERIFIFAPKFFRSQLGMLTDAMTKGGTSIGALPGLGSLPYAHLVPGLRKYTQATTAGDLARQTMLELVGGAIGLTYILNSTIGEDTDITDWMHPWTTLADGSKVANSNFLRVRFGGKDHSLLGPWDTLARLGSTFYNEGPEAFATDLLLFKASPLSRLGTEAIKSIFSEKGGLFTELGKDWDWTPGTHDLLKLGKNLVNIAAKTALPITAQTFINDGFGDGPFLTKVATTAAVIVGIKSSPVTSREDWQRELNNVSKQVSAQIRLEHPDWTDDQVKNYAMAQAKREKAVQDAKLTYVREAAAADRAWATLVLDKNNVTDKFKKAQEQRDLTLHFEWVARQKEPFEARAARLKDIDAQLAEMFDYPEIKALNAARDAASAAIDASQAKNKATQAANRGVQSQIEAIEAQIAGLKLQQNQYKREGVLLDSTLRAQAGVRAAGDSIEALEAQLSGLYKQFTKSTGSYVNFDFDANKAARDAIYHSLDPQIQALLDEQTALKAGQRTWENVVRDWADETSKDGIAYSARLAQLDETYAPELAQYGETAPDSREAEMYTYRNEVLNRYKNEFTGRIEDDSWPLIQEELSAYRGSLEAADGELYDFLFDTESRKTAEEQAIDKARNAILKGEGDFYGVDMRFNKIETTLYGAALVATGSLNQTISLIQQAMDNVRAENAEGVSAILAKIASSGADPGQLLGQFRSEMQNQAGRNGESRYIPFLNEITEASIRRADPNVPPAIVTLPDPVAYEAARAGQAAAAIQNSSTSPAPEYAPKPSSTYPATKPSAKSSAGVLQHWMDIVQEEYFGKRIDPRTGIVTQFTFADLAPDRMATYQYMFDNLLDTREKIVANATTLLKANINNPQLKLLIMSDPAVRTAFITDPDATTGTPPAARNYVIALDKVLRVLEGETLISESDAVAGFRQITADRYFTTYDAKTNPVISKIDGQIEAYYNDSRVKALDKQVSLIALDISDVYQMVKTGAIAQSEVDSRVAALEAQRVNLLTEKQRLIADNTVRIKDLQDQKSYLLDTPLPPGEEIFDFLLKRDADTREEIANELNQLYLNSANDPRVKNLLDVATGSGTPTPELQAWIQERQAQLIKANDSAMRLGKEVKDQAAIAEQIRKDLRDVLAFRDGFVDTEIGVARHIVAGSALMAALGGKSAVTPPDVQPLSLRSAQRRSSRRYRQPANTRRLTTPEYRTIRSMPPAPPPATPQVATAPAPAAPVDPASQFPEVSFGTQNWEQFRNTARTIFGSTKVADVFERAFVAGRPVSDASALRQAQFAYKLCPIEGARTFESWLSAMRSMYIGRATFGGSTSINRRPIPEIRTKRPL